ncbi:MAG: type II toxin-antitoxin system VapC family toxin [Candidatus Binataceae bacterium]
MEAFVDTSGLYALIDADDQAHQDAVQRWRALVTRKFSLITHAFVAVEAYAVVRRRLGISQCRDLQAILRRIDIHVVEKNLYEEGVAALLAAESRRLSLVDCVSFAFMRQRQIHEALAFDRDFDAQGFRAR